MIYEIHLTLDNPPINSFIGTCNLMGVKPLLIQTGDYLQVMTSSQNNDTICTNRLGWLRAAFKPFNIIREKVEIKPEANKHKNFIYYESHFRVKTKNRTLVPGEWFYKSKNLFKPDYEILTYRSYTESIDEFIHNVEVKKGNLTLNGFEYDKVEIEECILDTNIDYDSKWLNK